MAWGQAQGTRSSSVKLRSRGDPLLRMKVRRSTPGTVPVTCHSCDCGSQQKTWHRCHQEQAPTPKKEKRSGSTHQGSVGQVSTLGRPGWGSAVLRWTLKELGYSRASLQVREKNTAGLCPPFHMHPHGPKAPGPAGSCAPGASGHAAPHNTM